MPQIPALPEIKTETAEDEPSSKIEAVREYFTESKNYLDIRRYIIEIRKETVNEFTAGRTFRNILDIGCGDGSISLPLLNETNRLTLLDLSDAMLSRALSKVRPELLGNVVAINQDFLSTPLKPGSYDLIICLGVLAHVQRSEPVIETLSQLLQPGGLLVLECTDCAHFSIKLTIMISRVRNIFKRAKVYQTRLISADSIIRISQNSNLKLLSVYRHNLALPLMGKVLSQATLQKIIRWVFGTAKRNRNASLGKECIFAFELNR
jgi:2-polyprenyl-3-methyl-5-hydroxy-6-metoxy-1,4-benzoquinol methylase